MAAVKVSGGYRASLSLHFTSKSLGVFKTKEEAMAREREERIKLGLFYYPTEEDIRILNENQTWKKMIFNSIDVMVSDAGNIQTKQKRNDYKWTLVKQSISSYGYKIVSLGRKTFNVHRLVAFAFLGESDLFVNHKDLNKLNNHLSNLEYCTNRENSVHYHVMTRGKRRGVHKIIRGRKIYYVSEIKISNKRVYLGCFKSEEEAQKAYDFEFNKHFNYG